VEIEKDGKVSGYTATSSSSNLKKWTIHRKIATPCYQKLNYGSAGNIIRYKDEWILCLQTYPRTDLYITQPVRYGDGTA